MRVPGEGSRAPRPRMVSRELMGLPEARRQTVTAARERAASSFLPDSCLFLRARPYGGNSRRGVAWKNRAPPRGAGPPPTPSRAAASVDERGARSRRGRLAGADRRAHRPAASQGTALPGRDAARPQARKRCHSRSPAGEAAVRRGQSHRAPSGGELRRPCRTQRVPGKTSRASGAGWFSPPAETSSSSGRRPPAVRCSRSSTRSTLIEGRTSPRATRTP
jgi:hypothetical protein